MVPTTSSTLSQRFVSSQLTSTTLQDSCMFAAPSCNAAVSSQAGRIKTWPLYDLWLQGCSKGSKPKSWYCTHLFQDFLFSEFQVGFTGLIIVWVVVSNIFDFHPYLGNWSNLTNIFSDGLKPPTSCVSFVESNLPQLILIVTSRSLIDPSPLDPMRQESRACYIVIAG